jgi:septum formation protein
MNRTMLILASSSPRRQAFFQALGLDFRIETADIDETPQDGEAPDELVARLARAKGAKVAARLLAQEDDLLKREWLVVSADTTVALEGENLGKPDSPPAATEMLRRLRNRVHQVHSSVCVTPLDGSEARWRVNTTQVVMRNYSDAELAAYVASGDPFDKAGAYALQHPEFAPVADLQGCGAGVVGLPLADLVALLGEFGLLIERPLAPVCEAHVRFACCTRRQQGNSLS